MAAVRFRVTLREHVVRYGGAGRCWRVPGRVVVTSAADAPQACAQVVRWAHSDAGVPALRSLVAEGVHHASAEVYVDPNADKLERIRQRDERKRAAGR